jgi:FKBP-type peptidyl-prolyl cis-trans isomerase
MKISKLIVIAVAAAVMASCGNAPEGSKEVRAMLPATSEIDSTSYLLGVYFGNMINNYGFGKLNYTQILSGMKKAANAKGDPQDSTYLDQFRINPMESDRIINEHLRKMSEYKMALNDEKGKAFIEEYMKGEGVQVTESGLAYNIIEAGEELRATSLQDTVKVKYVGTRIDGSEFDNREEATFPLNGVIKGWGEGLQLVGKGGKIELVIPGELAYGERGNYGIEPNSTLKFEVEVLDVMPYVEPVVEEAPATTKKK